MIAGEAAFQIWLDNIGEEIWFWNDFAETRGGRWKEDFATRLRTDVSISSVDSRLGKRIALHPSKHIRMLDVGSGPLTSLGKVADGKTVEIIASDPLADVYNIILDRHGINPPIRPTFADAENLSQFFSPGHFDVVHCRNALDHSYDPIAAIFEMLKVVTADGFIQLSHFENEAQAEEYKGLHQWNFTEREGDFVIWNKTQEHSLSRIFGGAVTLDVERSKGETQDWIVLTLRRNEGTAQFLRTTSTTIGEKYRQSLLRHFIREIPEDASEKRQAS